MTKHSQDLEHMIICPVCNNVLIDPRLLPCGETTCFKCIPKEPLFKCLICHKLHETPFEGYISNKKAEELVDSLTKKSRLEENIKFIHKSLDDLEKKLDKGDQVILDYCAELRTNIHSKVETTIKTLTMLEKNFSDQIDKFEKQSIESYRNKTSFRGSLQEFIDETRKKIEKFVSFVKEESDVSENDLNLAMTILESYKNQLRIKKNELNKAIFSHKMMSFEENPNEFEPELIGLMSFKDIDLKASEIEDIDLVQPLAKLNIQSSKLEKYQIDILDNENFVILYKTVDDTSINLALFNKSENCFIKEICLKKYLECSSHMYDMFIFKNKVVIHVSNLVYVYNEELELLKSCCIDCEYIRSVAANECAIIFLVSKYNDGNFTENIEYKDWNLDYINPIFQTTDEFKPFYLEHPESWIKNIKIKNSKYFISYHNYIKIYNSNGDLKENISNFLTQDIPSYTSTYCSFSMYERYLIDSKDNLIWFDKNGYLNFLNLNDRKEFSVDIPENLIEKLYFIDNKDKFYFYDQHSIGIYPQDYFKSLPKKK